MASDLSHRFPKQVINVSQHVFVILLWGILTSPLSCALIVHYRFSAECIVSLIEGLCAHLPLHSHL